MLNQREVLDHIIRPTIGHMARGGQDAENLILGTALVESGLRHLVQVRGPALGLWQMEPATFEDHQAWLDVQGDTRLPERIEAVTGADPLAVGSGDLVFNLRLACAYARVHYLRRPGAIPEDVEGQANYWKTHYNTHLGRGTVEHYLRAWERAH